MNLDFIPCYVWPNEVIPFRLYFESNKLRVFIIENIQHNFNWLKRYRSGIRKTDFFIVLVGWHYHEWLVKEAKTSIEALELDIEKFYILFNDDREKILFESAGFHGEIINQNAWLDERLAMRPINCDKLYDAIYVARLVEFKRHYLASKVSNLAIIAGDSHRAIGVVPAPPNVFRNDKSLNSDEVCLKINQSKCGLILSEFEGACYASSEYLLCGIPVISTPSEGGRSVWYNEYNSIICDADPSSVADAVRAISTRVIDREKIRSDHVRLQYYYRFKFVTFFDRILRMHGVHDIDPVDYFFKNFIHKMRPYVKPNFDEIFKV